MALIGAGVGLISKFSEKDTNKRELERQKEIEKQKYELQKQYGDNLYALRKEEAIDQLDIQKKNLNEQLNQSMEDYNTNLLTQAYGMQDARIQSSSNIGMSLAAEGASGTRGNAANEMMRAYAGESLERNIDLQERQNSNYLDRMMTGANTAADAIQREKDSWEAGGYRGREKGLQDMYNYSMHDLGMSEYDHQIQRTDPWNFSFENILDYAGAGFGGAMSGFSFGNSLKENIKWKEFSHEEKKSKPKTDPWNFSKNIPRVPSFGG